MCTYNLSLYDGYSRHMALTERVKTLVWLYHHTLAGTIGRV